MVIYMAMEQEFIREQTPSMEDYLEAIAILGGKDRIVRVSQLSRRLEVKIAIVTPALRKFSERVHTEEPKGGKSGEAKKIWCY